MILPSGPLVTSTTTASGSSTRLRATYATRSWAAISPPSSLYWAPPITSDASVALATRASLWPRSAVLFRGRSGSDLSRNLGQNSGVLEKPRNGVRRERALGDPLLGLLGVDGELDRVCAGVVVTQGLDGATIAGAPAVHDYDPIRRLLGGTDAAETNAN